MGQQLKTRIKRQRRKAYLARKKELAKVATAAAGKKKKSSK